MLPYLVGPIALEKRQSLVNKKETIASNATVHPPIKILHGKAEEATNEPVQKKQKYYPISNNRVALLLAVLI